MTLKECKNSDDPQSCEEQKQKWSYAIPLEIIYTTPLLNWNPYGIDNIPSEVKFPRCRNGDAFCRTPIEFFADGGYTTSDTLDVTDQAGNTRKVTGSGMKTRMIIPGIGGIRLRYPIMPLSYEGSAARKELDALKRIMLRSGFSF